VEYGELYLFYLFLDCATTQDMPKLPKFPRLSLINLSALVNPLSRSINPTHITQQNINCINNIINNRLVVLLF